MCRRACIGFGSLALALVTAPAVAAQSSPAEIASAQEQALVERLERLEPHYEELRDTAMEIRQRREAAIEAAQAIDFSDPVRVGLLDVVAHPDQIEEAVRVYQQAWTHFAGLMDGVTSWGSDDAGQSFPFQRLRGNWAIQAARGVRVEPWHSEAQAVERATNSITRRIERFMLPKRVKDWSSFMAFPNEGDALEHAYRYLILTSSPATRGCFDGDPNRCWQALGLRDVDRSWETWYGPAEWREHVEQGVRGGQYYLDLREECLSGVAQSCLTYLRESRSFAPTPLDPKARSSMLGHALKVGGNGALARLIEGSPTATVEQRLVAASGLSADELVMSWRDAVLASRPEPQSRESIEVLSSSLLWTLVFMGLAMRSTRWRI